MIEATFLNILAMCVGYVSLGIVCIIGVFALIDYIEG